MLNEELESYIIGDINLNVLAFNKNNNDKTAHERSLSNMYESFKQLINKHNLNSYNTTKPTRNDTLLNIIYFNKPEKILYKKIIENKEGSDHSPVIIARAFMNEINNQQYILYRNYKNYDINDIYMKVVKDEKHVQILESTDPSYAMKLLIEMLSEATKKSAPIIKINIKKNDNTNKLNLNKETINYIKSVQLQKAIIKDKPNDIAEKQLLKKMEIILKK